jgi:hypothetical protein
MARAACCGVPSRHRVDFASEKLVAHGARRLEREVLLERIAVQPRSAGHGRSVVWIPPRGIHQLPVLRQRSKTRSFQRFVGHLLQAERGMSFRWRSV